MSNYAVVDIETIPTRDPKTIAKIKSNMKAPGNYKKPEAIARYIEDNWPAEVAKTGLDGAHGQIICIGLQLPNHAPLQWYDEDGEGERELLIDLRGTLCDAAGHKFCKTRVVGHNVRGFDIPFLSQRMMINGLPPLFRHGTKPWDMCDDTMLMFACGDHRMRSLDVLCHAFGIPTPKSKIDGSMIAELWATGRHDEIKEYNRDDVVATGALYRAMTIGQ